MRFRRALYSLDHAYPVFPLRRAPCPLRPLRRRALSARLRFRRGFLLTTTTMNRFLFALASCFGALLGVLPSYAQEANLSVSSQAAIAVRLESINYQEAEQALHDLLDQVEHEQLKYVVSPQLKSALRTALHNDIDRRKRIKAGETFKSPSEEYTRFLAETIIAVQDREAIPLLIEIAPMGNIIQYGLLDSGPSLVPFLVEYSNTPNLNDNQITGMLDMFSAALREWGEFDPEIREYVKYLVIRELSVPDDYTYPVNEPLGALHSAMYLASDLGDEDLRQMVIDLIPVDERLAFRPGGYRRPLTKYILENWNR